MAEPLQPRLPGGHPRQRLGRDPGAEIGRGGAPRLAGAPRPGPVGMVLGVGEPGGAERVAVVGRRRGHVQAREPAAGEDLAVVRRVERAAAGDHEVVARRQPLGLGQQHVHHLGEGRLPAGRQVGPADLAGIRRAAGEDRRHGVADHRGVGEAQAPALDPVEPAQQRHQLGIDPAVGRQSHDLPFLALALVEAGEVGDEAEEEADRFAAAVALDLAQAAGLHPVQRRGAGLAHAVDHEAGRVAERAAPAAVGRVGEVVRIATRSGDPGLSAKGPVEAEQGAVAGPRLGERQFGDQHPLGPLGHQRAVERRPVPGEGGEVEGAARRAGLQEVAVFRPPGGGDHHLAGRRQVGREQPGHAGRRIRLAVRRALVLEVALRRLGEEDRAVRPDQRQGRIVEGRGEAEIVARKGRCGSHGPGSTSPHRPRHTAIRCKPASAAAGRIGRPPGWAPRRAAIC